MSKENKQSNPFQDFKVSKPPSKPHCIHSLSNFNTDLLLFLTLKTIRYFLSAVLSLQYLAVAPEVHPEEEKRVQVVALVAPETEPQASRTLRRKLKHSRLNCKKLWRS